MKNFVCAVVVTYHPKPEDIENLAKVRPQVEDLVVVDNGSSAETLKLLRAASAAGTYTLIENGENLGIAAALNMGVQYSIDRGFVWTILFDQDSSVTPDYISAMLKAIESTKESFLNVGIFCPRYVDRNTGIERPLFNVDEYGEPLSNMTSGSMIPNELFKRIGLFSEELFIYCVDDEFCLRARKYGYRLMRVSDATLLHSEGEAQYKTVLGVSYYVTNQSAQKRYYIMRNQLWVYRRYPLSFPAINSSVSNLLRIAKTALRTLVLESDRFAKACAMIKGTFDFLRNRMGKVIEL